MENFLFYFFYKVINLMQILSFLSLKKYMNSNSIWLKLKVKLNLYINLKFNFKIQ